ncbi:family 43 glycosylhydrolase [Aporhodopirellula aestuarii]|uniref:Family 43 glycosylhydrolase n=1 Tax=Aporhodopirellula aestuarii TaxID=2950107 RepID=A0ABT0TXX4_9BACT|nr:family 43 glycosylhydrolase [Aporhodopirellula aestuarii]MCM2369113.1 family 43 glycosylhydrolase [Aporhodopirellula aestuarii]
MSYRAVLFSAVSMFLTTVACGQGFQGVVSDSESGSPLAGVSVLVVEDNVSATTRDDGGFAISIGNRDPKTLRFAIDGYMFAEKRGVEPATGLAIGLRKAKKSAATIREERYRADGCEIDNPMNPDWNIRFKSSLLKGDLAPDPTYTRRDPSAVIQVNGKYYVWYSYSLTHDTKKLAPWDLNDLYFATSTDGETWEEQGPAVTRGPESSFDHRSVFTTEIFVHDGVYYLIYQAAGDVDGIYNRNVIGMAKSESPDGPWTKVDEPVLRPTYTNEQYFDNNAVHDPCLIHYRDKFYLYYKGECICFEDEDCQRWCNPCCGLKKQVKWGVAIADHPTGPFIKSEFNPITNTGHEVMVWKYGTGIAILQHQDGPEAKTIQYAEDGVNFEIMGSAIDMPEAAGLFRPNDPENTPHGGIEWGLSHVLKWNAGPKGWMYIQKYQKVK